MPEKTEKQESDEPNQTHGFPSPFFNGFRFVGEYKLLYAPPSGRSLREATFKVLETGPLHNFLEKGVSEPSWVGKVVDETD